MNTQSSTPRHRSRLRRVATSLLWGAGLLSAFFAPGCLAQPARVNVLSEQAVVLPLPLLSQEELYQCGLISLVLLCEYYRTPLSVSQCEDLAMRASEQQGLSGAEMRSALESSGFEVFLFEGTLGPGDTGLYHHVDLGRPLIVMTSPGGSDHHYVLFLGYDLAHDNVCLLDPARGRVLEPRETFERSWARCRHFTLLAIPQEFKPSPLEIRS